MYVSAPVTVATTTMSICLMKLHVSDPLLRVRTVNACYLLTASHSHAPSLSPKTRLIPIFLQISGVLHAAAQQFCMCNFFLHQLMQGWKHYHVLVHRCINLLSDALWGSIFRGEGWKEFCHCCVCTQHLELPSLGACLHVLERWWWWWWWGGGSGRRLLTVTPIPAHMKK